LKYDLIGVVMSRIINIGNKDSTDFYFDVASGTIPTDLVVTKFSANEVVGTTYEDIWDGPASSLTYLTTAATLEAISDSVNDTAAGTHARKIIVYGLDENWDLISEEITLAGTSASSATTATFIRVYRAIVSEVGAYGNANDGNITIRVSSAGATQAYISFESTPDIGHAQTRMSHFTIPRGYKGYLLWADVGFAASKVVNFNILIRENANNTSSNFRAWRNIFHVHESRDKILKTPIVFQAYTDIRGIAVVDTGTAEVSFDYQLLLRSSYAI
jgi:hypothetical protein